MNRLASSSSPYLRSHAKNPVDWYPWGREALDRAKAEDKAVFVSIGYAACHWCHVMERESFEDEAVAALLNEHFISIKVDREERPDVDQLYMAATIAMTGSGGWPMTVFITPDGRPFFAGTYFPKTAKFGKPGFVDVLARIRSVWKDKRSDLEAQATALADAVREDAALGRPAAVGPDAEASAVRSILKGFDPIWGGFGGAPKFPAPFTLALLLRRGVEHGDANAREAAVVTLDRMARGGMYDHVGGGFARYSTDRYWHIPHFEKMLYDNAQLAKVYAEAHRATGDASFARVARETLDYLLREMTDARGGFFSATDADSEGVEGKFFVWTKDEFVEVVGPDDAELLSAAFDVSDAGNWEGYNVLWMKEPLAAVAAAHNLSEEDALTRISAAKERLRAARDARVKPLLDDKILAAWNGLLISALAVAGEILEEPRYLRAAARAAEFLRDRMRREDGRLVRSFRAPDVAGFLEDHAFVVDGLLDLFEATGDGSWLSLGLALAERALLDFRSDDGPFYNTGPAHEALAVRMLEGADGATASPNAVFARVLARLWKHTGREDLREAAEAAIVPFGAAIVRAPRAFVTALDVVSRLTGSAPEVALIGSPEDPNHRALDRAIASSPRRLSAVLRAKDETTRSHPLALGRPRVPDRAQAYVCRNFACERPVSTAEELNALLDSNRGASPPEATHVGHRKLEGRATASETAKVTSAERALAGLRVSAMGVTLGSFLLEDACGVIREAVARGVNVFLSEASRAEALGEGIRRVVAAGTPRASLVIIALLQGAAPDAITSFESKAGLYIDLALLPAEAHTIDLCFAAREGVGTRQGHELPFGLYLRAPLSAPAVERILSAATLGELACVAAPFSPLDEDDGSLATLSASGTPVLALKTLEWDRLPHTANLLELAEPLADAPPFDASLDKLRLLELRYQKTIAPHLATSGSVDPRDLLRFSDDLRKAERVLDDVSEVEAFIHQSVASTVSSAFGALDLEGAVVTGPSGDPLDLGREMHALREDYLEALDETLRALANAILMRQTSFGEAAAAQLTVARRGVPARLRELVSAAPGIRAAFATVRKPAEVSAVWA